MTKAIPSTKKLQIDKANYVIVVATSVAVFITIFSLVLTVSLLKQRAYQAKVISKKEIAVAQLKTNINEVNTLVDSYKQFVDTPDNIIGGSTTGSGDRDGDNAKIVLDALPSKYDFPAVVASLEKLVADSGNTIASIKGTDDELAQAAGTQSLPVEIPFEVSVNGNYGSLQKMIDVFERSIRPISAKTLKINGKDDQLVMSWVGNTYYQPQKSLTIKSEVVR